MIQSSTRLGVVCTSGVLLLTAVDEAAASGKLQIHPPVRTLGTKVALFSLGPMTFANGNAA